MPTPPTADPQPTRSANSAPARWRLPDRPDLRRLRRQAKKLRRRLASDDAAANELLATYDPGPGPVNLARAQRVIARAYGFAGWSKLREHLAVRVVWSREMSPTGPDDDPIDRFLRAACLSYTAPHDPERARELLQADPTLATATTATMAACGAAPELGARLRSDPAAVDRPSGPHRWPPILYLCFARLVLGDPTATLRVLLEAGADPNAGFLWRGLPSPFTALTGVLGGGERDEPPHPQAVELARLLLDAGADPNDNQAFYNRSFRPDDSHLSPLFEHGAGRPHPSRWRERLGSSYPSPAEMVGEHLRSAAARGFTGRVRTLLAYGVDPNSRGYHPSLGGLTAYEVAIGHGHADAVELLAAAGGRSDRLDEADWLLLAALAGDDATIRRLRPHAIDLIARRPDALRLAGEQHDLAAIDRLLTLGYPIDAAGPDGRTALHEAALRGADELCTALLDRGADPDVRDEEFGATPAGWAMHAGHHELAARLGSARGSS